jgi:hypothetical protein
MSKQAQADLILKLYDLRREPTMRAARDWFFREFHPDSVEYINNALFGEHSGHFRMVLTYWDMAAAMVNHGAIDIDFFTSTNGEYMSCFSKIEPFLADMRKTFGNPRFLKSLEALIDALPDGRQQAASFRERMKQIREGMAARQAQAQAAK